MRQPFRLAILLLILLIFAPHTPPAAHTQSGTPPAAIAAPTLKWAYGGCFTSWCQTGWYASPAVADLDNNGQAEVIWGAYDLVILNAANGALIKRAPNSSRVWPGIVVTDLTNNGSLEIVVGRGSDQVTAYTANGDIIWTKNPFGGGEVRTLAVEDLETDGSKEIIVGRAGSVSTRQLNVLDANGNQRAGWPARRNGEPGFGAGMYNQNVTIADLNNDGFKEIIGPTDTHYITALDRNGNQLPVNTLYGAGKVWSQVGVHVDQAADLRGFANCGTEHRPNFANMSPAIADLDGNGTREIIVPGDVYNCAIEDGPRGDLYIMPWILNLDRTRWKTASFDWTILPVPQPNSRPLSEDFTVIENSVSNIVPADLDGDGIKELIFAAYDGRMHAYWLDKTQRGAWPYRVPGVGFRFASEPVVADLDGDGTAEVIFTSWPEKTGGRVGQLHILDYLGNELHRLDLPAPRSGNWNGGLGAPTLANLDSDPDLELVIGTAQSGIVAYDLPNTAQARIRWATGRGNFQRTAAPSDPGEFFLSALPAFRSIQPGQTTTIQMQVRADTAFSGTVQLSATDPGPLTDIQISPTTLTPPANATLTITESTASRNTSSRSLVYHSRDGTTTGANAHLQRPGAGRRDCHTASADPQ